MSAKLVARALAYMEKEFQAEDGLLFTDEVTSKNYFKLRLGMEERECFEVAFLTSRHRLIACERLFMGTIDGSEVHPRIVLQRGLALNAAAIIIAHNHPSGDPDASMADKFLTRRIKDACDLVDIRLLDHIIVGRGGESMSFASKGWI